MTVFEAGTTRYGEDVVLVKRALSHLETQCGTPGSYALGEPVSRFGWTFFKIAMSPALLDGIEARFGQMIGRYGRGRPEELAAMFLSDFFESRGCALRIKAV